MTDQSASGSRDPENKRRPLRRWFAKYAYELLGVFTLSLVAGTVSFIRGYWSLPMVVEQLKAQQTTFDGRQRRDSARTDSLYRVQAGMVAVLCFGLSDAAFDKAQSLCGEAFYVSRVIADERIRKHQPQAPFR